MSQTATQRSQLFTIVIVFFFWGFIAASNGIFIPFCKTHFSLSQFQSQLIDLTFYGGYFIGSVCLFVYSRFTGADLLNKWGYKKGIIRGLLISALGALCIVPSVHLGSYPLILASYFLVALGFSIQQTCAQPFVIALGSSNTGATRLNLAGGINSLGTTIGPIAISYVLFGSMHSSASEASLQSIIGLYIGVCLLFALMALFFSLTSLPNITQTETIENGFGALKYPQLVLGMIAIFVYVGVEVTIQSNMGALLQLPEFGSYAESQLAPFISLYWGSLMIGRLTGAMSVFNLSKKVKLASQIIVPYLVFGLVLGINSLNGADVSGMYTYVFPIAVMVILSIWAGENQTLSLLLFSVLGFVAMVVGLATNGQTAIMAFMSGGLACSVLWPCIFSVAISGLGKYTGQGSAFLIMMIFGGAIIPPIQGLLSDTPAIGIHLSYVITLLCFGYLAYYAIKVKRILQQQGVTTDTLTTGH